MKIFVPYRKKLIISRTPDINDRQRIEFSKGYNILNNMNNNGIIYAQINNGNQTLNQYNNNEIYSQIQNRQNYGQINDIPLLNNYNINNYQNNEESKTNSDGKIFCSKTLDNYVIYANNSNQNNEKKYQFENKTNINGDVYSNIDEGLNFVASNNNIRTQTLNQQILYGENYASVMQNVPIIPDKKNSMFNNEFNSPTKNEIDDNIYEQRFTTIPNENKYELDDFKYQSSDEKKNKDDFSINYNKYIANDKYPENKKEKNGDINTPIKEKNNFNNIYNKFKSPLREYYPEFKDNGYSSKPSKKENMYHLQQYYNTQQPKEKFQSILTQNFKNYKDSSDINKNNQYLNIASTPLKEEELITSFENNTPSSEKNYTTYTQPINTDICNMPKVVKNLFGKKISIKNYSNLTKGGKEEDGLNKINQDSYISLTNINNIKDFNIFAVLDGHGPEGHKISKYAAQALIKYILSLPSIKSVQDLETIYYNLHQNNFQIIKQAFMTVDRQILNNNNIDTKYSGSTCIFLIILGNHIISASIGDSRGILIYDEDNDPNLNNLKVCQLSIDHKLEIPEERNRIIKSGGIIKQLKDSMGVASGPFRVFSRGSIYPGLAMSRSFGDSIAKSLGVISEPRIIEYNLNEKTKFIVLASDGIWEFLDNEKVKNIGKQYYLNYNSKELCEELYNSSLIQWQINDSIVDDITVIVIYF